MSPSLSLPKALLMSMCVMSLSLPKALLMSMCVMSLSLPKALRVEKEQLARDREREVHELELKLGELGSDLQALQVEKVPGSGLGWARLPSRSIMERSVL